MSQSKRVEDLVTNQTFIRYLGQVRGSLTGDRVTNVGILQLCTKFVGEVKVLETTEDLGSSLCCV